MSVQFTGAIREFNDAIINIIFKKNTVLINCKENFCNLITLILGYTLKISVDVNGTEVLFEPDEERNYRAVMIPSRWRE